MNTVNIPTDFFLKEAKREYCYLQDRLVAELFQNSIDAGATEIRFNFDSDGYSCEDNGCGMNEPRLISAMLTLGGSVKEDGSTGGFGAAKKLILFAHKSYTIYTNNIRVSGECLSYKLWYDEFRKGTFISAKYIDVKDLSPYSMAYATRTVLEKCYKPNIDVYINGEKFTSWLNLEKKIKSIELGDIYKGNKTEHGYGYVNVLHNGLYMFQSYVDGINVNYYLNVVDKPSVEVFTQNRENFRGTYSTAYNQLVSEIRTENKSFEKSKVKNFVWKGKEKFYNFILRAVEKTIPESIEEIRTLINQVSQTMSHAEIAAACLAALGDKAELVRTEIEEFSLPADFHVDGEKTTDELKKYHPITGLKKYKLLTTLYSDILVDLAKIYDVSTFTFALGLCFDAAGRFKKINDGNVFLINPGAWENSKTQKEKFYKIRSIAIHEFTHYLGFMRHDENFASKITEVTYMADVHLKGAVHYMRNASESTN